MLLRTGLVSRMGHIRLGKLPQSKKWRDVVGLLQTGGSVEDVARASAQAAESALATSADDQLFQYVARLLVELPLAARGPGFDEALAELGIERGAYSSVAQLAGAISDAIDDHARRLGSRSDLSEMAQMALVESLSSALEKQLPNLFEPDAQEIRRELGKLSSGNRFAGLARSFFSSVVYKSLDYYLSRELSNHVGPGARFASDSDRVAFDRAMALHAFEAARIVEAFAGGWYGKTVWQKDGLTPQAINKFTQYAFKKLRDELGRHRDAA